MTERYCTNCRQEIPEGSDVCAGCGVYAGDLFDGRLPADRERRRVWFGRVVRGVIVLGGVAALVWFGWPLLEQWSPRQQVLRAPAKVRVVRGRAGDRPVPAGEVGEAEAIRRLRRELTSAPQDPIKDDCLVVMSKGRQDDHWALSAYDHCQQTRIGGWRVSAKDGRVERGEE